MASIVHDWSMCCACMEEYEAIVSYHPQENPDRILQCQLAQLYSGEVYITPGTTS